MAAFKRFREALLALVGLLLAPPATAEPQAELTWLLDSGNLLPGPEPAPPPWEGLYGFRSGRDNRARLALAAKKDGALPGVSSAALLRVDLALRDAGQESPLRVRDASSWLAVSWLASRGARLGLRAFPLDTDYLRVGHLHALDWGGSDVARRESVFLRQSGGAPGLELSCLGPRLRLFALVKTARVEDAVRGPRRLWGGAVGGRFTLPSSLRLDVSFGAFQRPPTVLEGASVRLVWHRGAFEPELATEPLRPPSFRDDPEQLAAEPRSGWAVALEGVSLVTRQRQYEAPTEQVTTLAPAAALYGSWRRGGWAGHVVLTGRSLPFVLHDEPSLSADEALPARARSLPELGAWLGGSFTAEPLGLVPSVELGLRLPAALQRPGQTFVAGGVTGLTPLPLGAARGAVLALRASLRFRVSQLLSLSAWLEHQQDPNRARLLTSPSGLARGREPPASLALMGAAQARF